MASTFVVKRFAAPGDLSTRTIATAMTMKRAIRYVYDEAMLVIDRLERAGQMPNFSFRSSRGATGPHWILSVTSGSQKAQGAYKYVIEEIERESSGLGCGCG
jgi:hypothetical protein